MGVHGDQFGELGRRPDPRLPDLALVPVGEPPGDRVAREVQERVDTVEEVDSRRIGVPEPLARLRAVAYEPHDAVPGGGQPRAELGSHQPRRSGHGDGERLGGDLPGALERGQIGGEARVAEGEDRPQHGVGDAGVDAVDDGGAAVAIPELVLVDPSGEAVGQRGGAIQEPFALHVALGDVLGRPARQWEARCRRRQ